MELAQKQIELVKINSDSKAGLQPRALILNQKFQNYHPLMKKEIIWIHT